MTLSSKKVIKAADDLTEACFRGREDVRRLRTVALTMEGDEKDIVLSGIQYFMVKGKVAGLDKDEFMMMVAIAMERAYELKDPGPDAEWAPLKETVWN